MRKFVLCFKQEFGTPYSFEAFSRVSRVRLKAVCLQDLGWGFELAGIYNCRRLFVVVGNTKPCTLRSCFWCAGRRVGERSRPWTRDGKRFICAPRKKSSPPTTLPIISAPRIPSSPPTAFAKPHACGSSTLPAPTLTHHPRPLLRHHSRPHRLTARFYYTTARAHTTRAHFHIWHNTSGPDMSMWWVGGGWGGGGKCEP